MDAEGEAAGVTPDRGVRPETWEVVLDALDRGEEPDWEALKVAEAGRPDLERALARYRALVREVRSARGDCSLRPGDRVGDYEVSGLLGSGGMGEVYRARQLSLGGRSVALKVRRPSRQSSLDQERFEREALLLSRLHHPNLAEVHGFGEVQGFCFLAMRLVEGGTLAERIADRGRPIAARQAVGWIEQVAAALEVVHAAGLVHRDVKPSNIILEVNGERESAVLVDFGLARPVAGWTRTEEGAAPRTAAYAAPEQLRGERVDARSDVHSLGAVMRELLERCAESGPREQASSPALRSMLERALALDPAARYADAGRMRADLALWLEGRHEGFAGHGSLAPAASASARERRDVGRWIRRALPPGVAFGLCLLALWLARGPHSARADEATSGERAALALLRQGWTSAGAQLELLERELEQASLRPAALRELALVADRHPVIDAAGRAATASLRRGLRALEAQPEALGPERLDLVSLWSAVAEVEDCARLAERWPLLDPACEEARLVLQALERSLRRAWRQRDAAALLDGVGWDALCARALALRRADEPLHWSNVMALSRLLTELALSRRRLGREADPWAALPRDWLSANPRWSGQGCHELALELAACGDPTAFGVLAVFTSEQRSQWQAELAGRLAAWVGEPEWLERAAERLVELGWSAAPARAELERGFRAGLAERLEAWSAADVESEADVVRMPELDGREGPLLVERIDEPSGSACLDLCRRGGPTSSGEIRGASAVATSYQREGNDLPYLLLDSPGASALTVEFVLPSDHSWLKLAHVKGQSSSRRYLPQQGTAVLSLALDGAPWTTRAISNISASWIEFPIELRGIAPGLHRLTLSLEPGSTTSYRLECLALGE